jgi:hypothetical protein
MKIFYTLLFNIMIIAAVHSQAVIGPINRVASGNNESVGFERGQTPLYIDYSYLNNDQTSTRWSLNDYYNNSDTAVNYLGVAFDNICGYYDYENFSTTIVSSSDLGFSSVYPTDALLRYDSLQFFMAHENNSGVADTIIVELRELNTDNTISSTVLWADSAISSVGLSPGNTWSNGIASFFFKRFAVGYNNTAGQKIGAVIRYLNHNKLDTFGLAAGYISFGIGGATAQQSNYKNSFVRIPPSVPNITRNSDISFPTGGYFPGQNWIIIPRTEVFNTTLGLQSAKGDLPVLTVFPNPANQLLNIALHTEENSRIVIQLLNAQGQIVMLQERNTTVSNLYKESFDCSGLSGGLYHVMITQNDLTYTQRVVVSK